VFAGQQVNGFLAEQPFMLLQLHLKLPMLLVGSLQRSMVSHLNISSSGYHMLH
jgi:hypothetical protein